MGLVACAVQCFAVLCEVDRKGREDMPPGFFRFVGAILSGNRKVTFLMLRWVCDVDFPTLINDD
jgi:hypothetical protein